MDERFRQWGQALENVEALRGLPPEGVLARCIFGEARGVGLDEKEMVGCVVRNRVRWWRGRPWEPEGWAAIILQPHQFSWTLAGDPNRGKVLDPFNNTPDYVWFICCQVAERVVRGDTPDVTGGADHYYNKSLDDTPPYWASAMEATAVSEHFRFFRSDRAGEA